MGRFWAQAWQPAFLFTIGIVIVFGLLFFRLSNLVSPYSPAEIASRESAKNIAQISKDPLNAPHKAGQYLLQKAGRKGPLAMRSISALFGILAVCMFFLVARLWFTDRIAALISILFSTSTWFLATTRSATPYIMLTAVLALIVAGSWLRYSRKRSLAFITVAGIAALSIYIPGMVWFVVGFLIWQRRGVRKEMRLTPTLAILGAVLIVITLLLPLAIVISRQPHILENLLGLPADLPTVKDIGNNLIGIPMQLFVKGPDNPAFWLGSLPVLDIFSTSMFILGTYRLYYQRKLDRTKLLMVSLATGSLLIALGGPVNLTLILPFVYIVVASGISLMLQQWFTVFPKNPLARNIGVTILTIPLLISVFYNLNRYFVAWPQAPATKQVYSQKP